MGRLILLAVEDGFGAPVPCRLGVELPVGLGDPLGREGGAGLDGPGDSDSCNVHAVVFQLVVEQGGR